MSFVSKALSLLRRAAVRGFAPLGLRRSRLAALGGAALLALGTSASAEDASAPDAHLDLDTGGHRAVIRALAAAPDGTKLWSAGDDKVIREWSLTQKKPGAILRGQIGAGSEGSLNALALSADGKYLAVGGYFAPHLSLGSAYGDIRIYDTASGQITSVLKGFDWVVTSLAYDAAGDVLAVSGQGGMIQRWETPFGAAPQRLPDLDTQSSRVMALAYLDGGKVLAAATFDYGVHLFDAETGTVIEVEDPEPLWDAPVLALAAAPDGKSFALSSEDGGLQIRSASGALLARPEPVSFRPDALVWTEGLLTVACGYRCGRDHGLVTYRQPQREGEAWQMAGSDPALRQIRAAIPLPLRGEIALAGGEVPQIEVTKHPVLGAKSSPIRFAGIGRPVTAVAISADGTKIAWGNDDTCPGRALCPEVLGKLTYSMQLPSGDLSATPPKPLAGPAEDLNRALLSSDGITLTSGMAADSLFEGSSVSISGPEGQVTLTRSALDGSYISAMGLVPGAAEVITGGGNGVLLAQSVTDGRVTGEFIGHTADVLALAIAPEAGRMVTGGADQTLRIWNLNSRKLIASLFASGEDWILWTPEGYFHSSPEGDRLIGWHLNQGQDKEARFIMARQLRQHLHSPEIVRRALLIGDPGKAAIELRGTDRELTELLSRPAPDFNLSIRSDLPSPEGTAIIEVSGASLEEMEAWGFAVLVNDRRVPATRIPPPEGAARQDPPEDAAVPEDGPPHIGAALPPKAIEEEPGRRNRRRGGGETATASPGEKQNTDAPKPPPSLLASFFYQIPVDDGENEILVAGQNDFGYVTERSGKALFRAPVAAEKPGRLFVAVIGINRYPQLDDCGGRSCELAFPVADAIGFLRTVKSYSAPLFSQIETLVIASPEDLEAVGAADVIDPATVLAPEGKVITEALIDFLAKPGPEDTTIIFVASHGVNLGEDFYIVPADAQKRGEEFRKSSLVDWSVIQEEIGFATGRRILMLDTCHAANAFNAKLEKEAADARVIVFSATAANNTAQEKRDLGHGIFTYSVIQGLSGKASDGSGVRLLGLADFIYREVVRLSDGRQEPFYHISQTANFLLSKG